MEAVFMGHTSVVGNLLNISLNVTYATEGVTCQITFNRLFSGMISLSKKSRADRPEFIFVGEHLAIDFANTLSMSQGHWIDHLRAWADVIDWLSLAGLSTDPALQIPASRSAEAVKSVVELAGPGRLNWISLLRAAKSVMTSSSG
jgi:hypothetical protein